MAALADPDRVSVWQKIMAEISREPSVVAGVLKSDLRAAINAADDWADTNAAAFNAALPLPARTALSPRQKAMLLAYVIQQRWIAS